MYKEIPLLKLKLRRSKQIKAKAETSINNFY